MTANINLYSHCCWICLQRVLRTFVYLFWGGGVHKGVSFLLVWFEPKPGSDLFVRLIKLLEQIPPPSNTASQIHTWSRKVCKSCGKEASQPKRWLMFSACSMEPACTSFICCVGVRLDSRCLFYKMKTLASPNLKKSYLPAHMFLPSAFKTAWVQLIILGLFL